LRFAFDSLFAFLTTLFTGDYSRSLELGVTSYKDAGELVAYFSIMYAIAFALFALMQGHILKKKELLSFNAFEIAMTQQMRMIRWGQCFIALITAGLAGFSPVHPMAGALLGTFGLVYWYAEKRYPSKHLMVAHSDS